MLQAAFPRGSGAKSSVNVGPHHDAVCRRERIDCGAVKSRIEGRIDLRRVARSSSLAAVVPHLAGTDGPLSLVTLGTHLRKAGVPVKNDGLGPLLRQLAQEGRVFGHPV